LDLNRVFDVAATNVIRIPDLHGAGNAPRNQKQNRFISLLQDLKTGTKAIGAFLLIALIIVGVAVVGYRSLKSVNAGMITMYDDRLLPAQQLGDINEAQLKIGRDLYRYILEPENRGKLEQDIAAHIKAAEETLRQYELTYLVPDEERGLAQFKPAWTKYLKAVNACMQEVKTGKTREALQNIGERGAVFGAQQPVNQVLTRLIKVQVQVGMDLKQQSDRTFSRAGVLMIIAGLFGVLFAIVLAILITRSITIPLAGITRTATEIAKGNLDTSSLARLESRDEIGVLSRAFVLMAEQLRQTLAGLHKEIDERVRAEEETKELIEKLEDKNAELERFTYTVSHDLKSPLITIKGFLGLIREDVSKGNMAQLYSDMERIGGAADKMKLLLDELLELSRIGRMVNPPEAVSMTDIAKEAVELISGQIAERRVRIDIAPDMPVVYIDRTRFLQLLENLIENAVKFIGDQPEPQIEIGFRRADAETVFYVSDNGMGIDPPFLEKIFGLFDKLDQKSEGTGIGLAIVKRIVEVHGGRIWAESEGAGKGSLFCFTLPGETEHNKKREGMTA
jgi:signal transduction histidine kinase